MNQVFSRVNQYLSISLFALVACGGGGGNSPVPPTAISASFSLDEDTTLTNNVSGSAGESGSLSFSIQSQPSNGQVSLSGTEFVYTPNVDYFGVDSFQFSVLEGTLSSTATVSLTVNPINDVPVAVDSAESVDEDNNLSANLNFSDVDSVELTFTIFESPLNGEVLLNADGTFEYTSEENYFGADSFQFIVSDGELDSDVSLVTIDINSVNDAPVAIEQEIDVIAGQSLEFQLSASDIENDALVYEITASPTKLIIDAGPDENGLVNATAPYGIYGADSLTFGASDENLSGTANIDFEITVPQTEPLTTEYIYDAGGQLIPLTVIQDESENTIVAGNVWGTIGDQSSAFPIREFFSIHDRDNQLIKTVYFGEGQSQYQYSVLGVEENKPVLLGISELDAYYTTLDENYDVDLTFAYSIPYSIVRSNINLSPVKVPGVGFYIIGNDNQLTWIDFDGNLRSTNAIDNQLGFEINRWEILDSKIINDVVYIAGGYRICDDEPETCASGLGQGSFLLTADLIGNPISLVHLTSAFANDLKILSDGRLSLTGRSTLYLIDINGSVEWQRTVDNGFSGTVNLGPENDILWWNINRDTGISTATRLNIDNTIEWQTSYDTLLQGSYWSNSSLVDEYGNMYINYIDRYNSDDNFSAFGEFVTIHYDYSGTRQWTERTSASDFAPNNKNDFPISIRTNDNRIISIARDNINAGGSETDGFMIETKISTQE